MIEKTVLDYLDSALDVPVYLEQPKSKPNEYVLIKIISMGRVNYINNASFYLRSISTSLFNASKLNKDVMNAMDAIISEDSISASKIGGMTQDIDTTTKTYAYECVYNLVFTED